MRSSVLCALLLQCRLFGLVSDITQLDVCNRNTGYGVYLWTAGFIGNIHQRHWTWGLYTPGTRQFAPNPPNPDYPQDIWTYTLMDFDMWSPGQPDYGPYAYCVNIWPERSYYWNDEQCQHEYCFVCENRNY